MEIRYGRKRSGIKRELTKKIEEWLVSITDEVAQQAARKDTIVTGGSIASMLLGERINDFDIYFRTAETTKLIAEYYVKQFNDIAAANPKYSGYLPIVQTKRFLNLKKEYEERIIIMIQSAGVVGELQEKYRFFETLTEEETTAFTESLINKEAEKGDSPKYRPVFMSQNAITLSDKIQLVIRFYGEPDKIHSNYDFIHATCYWDHSNQKLELPAAALETLLSRTLLYMGSLYPIASIFRAKKFIERGWRINAGQLLKIMWQISEIDLTDPAILREQLTGVDQAYMWQLIEALKSVEPEKINSSYVAKIIDKIFD